MTTVRRRATIRGRVQGVYYRDSCRSAAVALGVRGWVRNLPDGSVQVVAEGDDDAVRRLLEWCREGPPRAVVTDVRIVEETPAAEREFRVRY